MYNILASEPLKQLLTTPTVYMLSPSFFLTLPQPQWVYIVIRVLVFTMLGGGRGDLACGGGGGDDGSGSGRGGQYNNTQTLFFCVSSAATSQCIYNKIVLWL